MVTPGVVYMVGSSFEVCEADLYCEGPRLKQWLDMYLAHNNYVFTLEGGATETWTNFANYIDTHVTNRIAGGWAYMVIDACVIGFTEEAFYDTSFSMIATAAAHVSQLKIIGTTVIALDYPPLTGKAVPYLTDVANIDVNWWDNTWRPAYRAAMLAEGAVILDAHYDWEPNNRMSATTAPHPDYHISSESSKKAASRIYQYLMNNTSLGSKNIVLTQV